MIDMIEPMTRIRNLSIMLVPLHHFPFLFIHSHNQLLLHSDQVGVLPCNGLNVPSSPTHSLHHS